MIDRRDHTRLNKLREVASKLKRGKNVQNRSLRTWLGDEAYGELEAAWEEQKALRAELKDKPEAVRDYEELLRTANFWHNRATAAEAKGLSSQSNLEDLAESAFEDALERLRESVLDDPSLQVWYDRPLDFGEGSDLQPNAASMPMVVTSRSKQNIGGGLMWRKQTKLQIKLEAVEEEIRRLEDSTSPRAPRRIDVSDILGRSSKLK